MAKAKGKTKSPDIYIVSLARQQAHNDWLAEYHRLRAEKCPKGFQTTGRMSLVDIDGSRWATEDYERSDDNKREIIRILIIEHDSYGLDIIEAEDAGKRVEYEGKQSENKHPVKKSKGLKSMVKEAQA